MQNPSSCLSANSGAQLHACGRQLRLAAAERPQEGHRSHAGIPQYSSHLQQ